MARTSSRIPHVSSRVRMAINLRPHLQPCTPARVRGTAPPTSVLYATMNSARLQHSKCICGVRHTTSVFTCVLTKNAVGRSFRHLVGCVSMLNEIDVEYKDISMPKKQSSH